MEEVPPNFSLGQALDIYLSTIKFGSGDDDVMFVAATREAKKTGAAIS